MKIELYSKLNDPIAAIDRLGTMFAKSGMFGCDRAEQGQMLAMICLAEHKSPTEITRNYDIIDGKLRKKAMSALAEFRIRGGKHRWLHTGDDGQVAELELTYEGQTVKTAFTIEHAKSQGLVRPNSNWVKTPGNMLRARCISNGVAMIAPEIYTGEDAPEADATQPAAPLLKPAKKAEVTTETSPSEPAPVKVVEVEVVKEVVPEPAKVEAPAQPTAPFTAKDIAQGTNGKLTPATVAALETAIGDENASKAIEWLKSHGWITSTLADLSLVRARGIFNKPDRFIRHIQGAA